MDKWETEDGGNRCYDGVGDLVHLSRNKASKTLDRTVDREG